MATPAVATKTVTIKVLTIDNKSMTKTYFRQLPVVPWSKLDSQQTSKLDWWGYVREYVANNEVLVGVISFGGQLGRVNFNSTAVAHDVIGKYKLAQLFTGN